MGDILVRLARSNKKLSDRLCELRESSNSSHSKDTCIQRSKLMLLSGCSITVSGKFPGYTQAKLKTLLTSNGAKFEANVTSTATHLITQPPEFDKPSQKLSDAWAKNIPAVSLGWLLDSAKENKRLDESNYSYKSPDSQGGDVQADGKKRKKVEPRDDTEEPQEKFVKRQRGKEAEPELAVDDVQDTAMDEPSEELVEEMPKKGRGRPKKIRVEVLEEENDQAAMKEPKEPRKRGRPTKRINEEVDDIGVKGAERVGGQKETAKKRGRPAKKTVKLEPEMVSEETLMEDTSLGANQITEAKGAEVPKKGQRSTSHIVKIKPVEEEAIVGEEEPKQRGRPKKKAVKQELEANAEETLADDVTSGKKQSVLPMKFMDDVKAKTEVKKKKNVSIDDGCPLTATYHVYIDPSGMVFDAALNQTNIGQNSNKFYYVQLLESNTGTTYATWTHWGRVGEFGQNALFSDKPLEEAKKIFETKFKDKSGLKWENRHDAPKAKKYTLIEKNYMDDDVEGEEVGVEGNNEVDKPERKPIPASKISPELQSLMKLIFNPVHIASSMASMRYDASKLPLGKLSKKTLSQGFAALKDLGEVVINPALAQSKYGKPLQNVFADLTSKYYTVIPHSFGRMRPPVIDSEATLKKEIELVETLGDMEIANEIMKDAEYLVDADGSPIHPLDSQFNSLNLQEVAVVNKSTTEFAELEAYLRKSQKYLSRCRLVEVFRITRPGEAERFEEGKFSADKVNTHKVNDARKLLWHGSRSTNFAGILSQGLRIAPPEAPVNGYAFGKGIYLADLASKSCEYVYHETSGNQGLLILCEAQLGDPVYERYTHDSNAASNSKKQGALSTWAQGKMQPAGWKAAETISQHLKGVLMPDVDKGLVSPHSMPPEAWIPDNEYIVYSAAQVKIRYLFRVDFSLSVASVASAAANCNVV